MVIIIYLTKKSLESCVCGQVNTHLNLAGFVTLETGYNGNSYLSLEDWVSGQEIADLNFALIWYSIGKKIDYSWPLTDTAPNKIDKGRRPPRPSFTVRRGHPEM